MVKEIHGRWKSTYKEFCRISKNCRSFYAINAFSGVAMAKPAGLKLED